MSCSLPLSHAEPHRTDPRARDSYPHGVPLSHIAKQLGFENQAEALAFLAENKADTLKPPTPPDKDGVQTGPVLDSKQAGPRFAEAMASISRVDLKGQI